jgi:hypothetical protein
MPARAPAVGGAQADAAMASAMEQDAPAAAGEPDGGDTQAYAQRLLHIYQDQNQVQAWIRDAALAPAHIAAVAQALAGQLSAQGTRLSALTVNGRAVALGYAAGAAGGFQDAIEIISGAPTPPGQTKEEEQ